jgi:hypothetical protein
MRTQAGWPWKGPTTSSLAVEEVEADPVQLRQRVVDQRRQVGGVGDAVALAVQQAARLRSASSAYCSACCRSGWRRMVTSSGLALLTRGFVPSELGHRSFALDARPADGLHGVQRRASRVLSWILWRLNAHALRRADFLALDAWRTLPHAAAKSARMR